MKMSYVRCTDGARVRPGLVSAGRLVPGLSTLAGALVLSLAVATPVAGQSVRSEAERARDGKPRGAAPGLITGAQALLGTWGRLTSPIDRAQPRPRVTGEEALRGARTPRR